MLETVSSQRTQSLEQAGFTDKQVQFLDQILDQILTAQQNESAKNERFIQSIEN